MYLLDTSVLVDYLRRYAPAVAYLDSLLSKAQDERSGGAAVSFATALELYAGVRTKRDQQIASSLLAHFSVRAADNAIASKSIAIMQEYLHATGLDIPDCIIAATAIVKGYTLLTRNVKHFQPIDRVKAETPY
ncbi:MAG: type II toxin-antitoxin system VapC family toxin [Patescibacteria group bacterium]